MTWLFYSHGNIISIYLVRVVCVNFNVKNFFLMLCCSRFWRRSRGEGDQWGVQDLEEEHSFSLWSGHDPCPGVAQPHCPVAAGRHQVSVRSHALVGGRRWEFNIGMSGISFFCRYPFKHLFPIPILSHTHMCSQQCTHSHCVQWFDNNLLSLQNFFLGHIIMGYWVYSTFWSVP